MFINVLYKKITGLPVNFLDNPVKLMINYQLFINGMFGHKDLVVADTCGIETLIIGEYHGAEQLVRVSQYPLCDCLIGGKAHQDIRPLVAFELEPADGANHIFARIRDVFGIVSEHEIHVVMVCKSGIRDAAVPPHAFIRFEI